MSNSNLLTLVFHYFRVLVAHHDGYDKETETSRSSSRIKVSSGRDFRQAGTKGDVASQDKQPDHVSITFSTQEEDRF